MNKFDHNVTRAIDVGVRAPNMRVQRTRSSPAALMRHPAKGVARCAALIGLAILLCASLLGAQPRAAVVRQTIKKNLHFDFHCFCKAVTPSTVSAVLKAVSKDDIPILIDLLDDKDDGVRIGARDVLVGIGEVARPALVEATGSKSPSRRYEATEALIELNSPRNPSRE